MKKLTNKEVYSFINLGGFIAVVASLSFFIYTLYKYY